jgi:hypothetical protein
MGFNIGLPDGHFGRSDYAEGRRGFGDGAGEVLATRRFALVLDDAE